MRTRPILRLEKFYTRGRIFALLALKLPIIFHFLIALSRARNFHRYRKNIKLFDEVLFERVQFFSVEAAFEALEEFRVGVGELGEAGSE